MPARLLCKFNGDFMDIYSCKFCKPHTKITKITVYKEHAILTDPKIVL